MIDINQWGGVGGEVGKIGLKWQQLEVAELSGKTLHGVLKC